MKLESIKAIARALDDAQVRYLVVGGLAVTLHGYSRATQDLDIVLALDSENISKGFNALKGLGYRPSAPVTMEEFADVTTRSRWIKEKGMQVLNLVSDAHPETSVDIFVTEPFDFNAEYGKAYEQQLDAGVSLKVVSIDTLIEMKRAAGRKLDQLDVEELEKIKSVLDE